MELTMADHVIRLCQFIIVLNKYDNYEILQDIYDVI